MTLSAPPRTVPIAEIFGPTLQGEGALAGLPTYFIRTGGCDFACDWCDSDHAVDPKKVRQLERLTQLEITQSLTTLALKNPGPDWVTISGGNPGLHDLSDVVRIWKQSSSASGWLRKVAVETQGTKWQRWFEDVDLLTVSPKPPSSGMTDKQNIDQFMSYVAGAEENNHLRHVQARGAGASLPPDFWRMVFKVVVFDEDDYLFAQELHRRWPMIKFYLSCGTAMGGLSGRWVPPVIPDLDPDDDRDHDWFRSLRGPLEKGFGVYPEGHGNPNAVPRWMPEVYIEPARHLLRRYRWLADRMKDDPYMSDVAAFPQLHALTWGIETRGV